MSVVEFSAVTKSYLLEDSNTRRLGALLFPRFFSSPKFTALYDLSFDVRRGETFCIIGRNGAGKSTLLELVAGISQPTSGAVRVAGRVSALLELGMGFHPDFTGRQNVFLAASILGFSAGEARRLYPHVAEFAGIGDFLERPVRTYSSGMLMRLAFALAIHVDPEILIVDEALSVGDQAFRQRCLRKVQELRARGVSILFVSHAMGEVKSIGDRALWLDHGKLRELGPADRVSDSYLAALAEKSRPSRQPAAPHSDGRPTLPAVSDLQLDWLDNLTNCDGRRGDGRARIYGFALLDALGRLATQLVPRDSYVAKLSFEALDFLERPQTGILIRNHLGIAFSGVATLRSNGPIAALSAGERCTVELRFTLPQFYPGFFSFSPTVFTTPDPQGAASEPCDWVDNALTLQMGKAAGEVYGSMHVTARVRWSRPSVDQELPRA
jgi:ABC-type polysaccharide/polyol phosphate transport system ATPase subunit